MPNSNVEDSLCEALHAAGCDYELAVQAIEAACQKIATGEGRSEAFDSLQAIAVRTRQTEAHVAQLRDAWSREGRRPGPRLQQVLRRQEDILAGLIRSLDEAERIAQSVRKQIVPAIDGAARSHRMRSAYATTVRQAVE